jgi:hypothetical protein
MDGSPLGVMQGVQFHQYMSRGVQTPEQESLGERSPVQTPYIQWRTMMPEQSPVAGQGSAQSV